LIWIDGFTAIKGREPMSKLAIEGLHLRVPYMLMLFEQPQRLANHLAGGGVTT